MARLLNKLGADLLGSIIQKVNKTLDVVRDSFTYAEQMGAIFKFLVDQTQTPNSKVCNFIIIIFSSNCIAMYESNDKSLFTKFYTYWI